MLILPGMYVSKLRVWEIKERSGSSMQEYYKTLRHLDMDSKHIAVVVIEGAFAGSRLLLAGGTIL